MRAPRAALIDSGVDVARLRTSGRALPNVVYSQSLVERSADVDDLGHGSLLASVLAERVFGVELLVFRIFEDVPLAPLDRLISAIDRALEHEVDVINLSLGTLNPEDAHAFGPRLERAQERGIQIVAPAIWQGTWAYPGSLVGALGVIDDDTLEFGIVLARRFDQFRVFHYAAPRAPGQPGTGGVSLATALVSATLLANLPNRNRASENQK